MTKDEDAVFFWLSFADADRPKGEQNLGCTLVAAASFQDAIVVAHRLGINPGGEVQGVGFPDDGSLNSDQLAFMLNSLRSREEMEAAELILVRVE